RLWLLVTTIHAVASVVKRAAPGLEPGCLPVRLWCIVTSLAGLAVLVKSPSVRRYRSRVGTRSDSSRSPPPWSPPQRARESASDAQRGRSPWPALAERPRVRRCLRCGDGDRTRHLRKTHTWGRPRPTGSSHESTSPGGTRRRRTLPLPA